MTLNSRNVFLLDGIGALASAVFTGIILPLFSNLIGIPLGLLYCLAIFPLIFGAYSIWCYRHPRPIKPLMLKTIILANSFYSVVSCAIILFFPGLTNWGRLLLAAEIMILIGVISIESNIYRKLLSATALKRAN